MCACPARFSGHTADDFTVDLNVKLLQWSKTKDKVERYAGFLLPCVRIKFVFVTLCACT